MSVITTLADAKTRLAFEIQASVPPVLTDADLTMILSKLARGSVWAASAVIRIGDIVLPSVSNGHRYRAVTAGTTTASQPTWPVTGYSTIQEGLIIWVEDGEEYDLWDMDMAIYEGWKIKKAKAVIYIGSDEGLSDVYEHCADMVDRSKPLRVA